MEEEIRKETEVQQNEGTCPGSPDSAVPRAVCSDMEPAFCSLASVGILDDFLASC